MSGNNTASTTVWAIMQRPQCPKKAKTDVTCTVMHNIIKTCRMHQSGTISETMVDVLVEMLEFGMRTGDVYTDIQNTYRRVYIAIGLYSFKSIYKSWVTSIRLDMTATNREKDHVQLFAVDQLRLIGEHCTLHNFSIADAARAIDILLMFTRPSST